jgi:hypothetical protein
LSWLRATILAKDGKNSRRLKFADSLLTAERHIDMRLLVAIVSIFLGCLLTGAPVDVSSPGEDGLRKLYGKPTMERFAVRSGITLTDECGPDRMACQLLIAPAQPLVELQTPIPPMPSQGVSDDDRNARSCSRLVNIGANSVTKRLFSSHG